MLENKTCLSAAFRFAAGQKSISADDRVVFAEMFYFCQFLLYKALGLLVSVQSQNYPSQNMCEQSQLWPHFATSQLHTMDFLVKSLNLNLAHSLTTHPSYAAKWSNKEGDYSVVWDL